MSKVNCKECLKGNCKKCLSEECLCRESHKSLCLNCQKKEAVGGIVYGDFCSNECKIHWILNNPKAVEDTYTNGHKVEVITEYLKLHKDYREIIPSLRVNPRMTFNFNVLDNDTLSHWFIQDAENFPDLIKSAILRVFQEFGGSEKIGVIAAREMSVVITESLGIKLNEWSSQHEGIPLQVECQIISAGVQETYTKHAECYCAGCGDKRDVKSLGILPHCGNKDCDRKRDRMIVDWSTVKTGDVKVFVIQEPIEQAKHGTPASFPLTVKDEYVKTTFIGQRKRIIGVFRSQVQKGKDTNSIMINAISLTDLDDAKDLEPDKETLRFFQELRKKKNFLDVLIDSISPELKHERLAKLCVLLACVGGTHAGRLRGDIHGILVGPPSTGKSTLLQFIPLMTQKSGFANGSTMSGSGVTASMDILPNRQKIVRAGIIPLCTGGIVAIDELNQLGDEELAKMFEAMETGKIHYNKGGFDQMFDARTTIMGGANPKGYEYNWEMSMMDNLSFMPPPMISRFDLVTNMLSEKTEDEEDEIEDHILLIRKIGVDEYVKQNNLLTPTQLLLFINHVKTFSPKMDPEAEKILKIFSKSMRKIKITQVGMKKVDKRFFESMIRLSMAIAKIYMSKMVHEDHADMAIQIYKQNLESFRIDTSEGVSVHKQEQFVTGKKSAFETALHRLQAQSKDGRFTETAAIEFIVEKYPNYFGHEDNVQKMFDEYYNKGKLGKRGGRYRLE